jgi:hypothetical protein
MNQLQYQLEMVAFDEKIALADLEKAKAAERVKELIYEKARFQMQWLIQVAQAQEKANQAQVPTQQG